MYITNNDVGTSMGRIGGTSMLPADQRMALMNACNSHPQVAELRRWLNDAPNVMTQTGKGPILNYTLGNQETISCIHWKGQFYVTGTDIVKILKFRFVCMGKNVGNLKKFEEGIFSDLRNLKAGDHATLEEPRSEFLEFLYRHNCVRTQKKQKVFFWYEVRHDDLVCEAFERDAKRQNTTNTINSFIQAHRQQQQQFIPGAMLTGAAGFPGIYPQMISNTGRSPYIQPQPQTMMVGMSPRLVPKATFPSPYYGMLDAGNPMMALPSPYLRAPTVSRREQPANPAMQAFEQDIDGLIGSPVNLASDFIGAFDADGLEDNLPIYEPSPKSLRLANGTPTPNAGGKPGNMERVKVVSPGPNGAVDPSLLSALPAKAKRQVHQAQNTHHMVPMKGMSPLVAEIKDPLAIPNNTTSSLGDPFDFDGAALANFNLDFLDLSAAADKPFCGAEDLFF